MAVVHAGAADFADGVFQMAQDAGGVFGGDAVENIPPDGKNRPVVDAGEDAAPHGQDFVLGVGHLGAADQAQGRHIGVHTGQPFVENHSVGDDGAGHAAGLGDIGHPQQAGNCGGNVGPLLRHFVQHIGGAFNAPFQVVGGGGHGLLRHGHQSDEVGQIGSAPVDPAGLGEAVAVIVEDAVADAGRRERGRQVVSGGQLLRVAQGDDGFHRAGFAGDGGAEPGSGVGFGVGVGFVLGFQYDGGAAGGGYQDVGVPAGVAGDGLRGFGADGIAGQHRAQQAAEGGVGGFLGLMGHCH